MQQDFDLRGFLPYLLNLAAEEAGLGFQALYKSRYGMLRTEWRVLFHLGQSGEITASEICTRVRLHKTKVSRAVAALGAQRFVQRLPAPHDRRAEVLRLTDAGRAAFVDLRARAAVYDASLLAGFTSDEAAALRRDLSRLAKL